MLAHSARPKLEIPAQGYWEHVSAVVAEASSNVRDASEFWRGDRQFIEVVVEYAALVHDLGKLDTDNQKVLGSTSKGGLPWAHEDAGIKHLLDQRQIEAALLVASHHAGLPNEPAERNKKNDYCRSDKPGVRERTNSLLPEYLREQQTACLKTVQVRPPGLKGMDWSNLAHRIALSCLVDADHGDTARNYRNESDTAPPPTNWVRRIDALDRYVAGLPRDEVDPERAEVRQLVYKACRDLPKLGSMLACDAGVGTGKTTAVMAHCLRVAAELKLRHVIVVLPYTNIIQQSVRTYRTALCLDGEDPEQVIAEHHHQADFRKPESRQLATLWNCPVTVTTAVQFFETLASNSTARLRKLHELPGSAIFIDEAHAAIPTWLWRQTWKWLRELADDWGCHIVLASGSLARFWQVQSVVEKTTAIPDMIADDLRQRIQSGERQRVIIQSRAEPLNLPSLIEFVKDRKSPRLVILNTVQSAAVLANEMKVNSDVMHLSTVLTPIDRGRIIERIKKRLDSRDD
ncbi:MAG: DEAD/DEAH box helicase family protein [Acidobacteriota bacterium]|nr:DEAD/DEAH box helicase family protein [Acidobacteriota bacterium]